MLRDQMLLVMSWTEILTAYSLFENSFILRRPKVSNFAGLTKIATRLIETTFQIWKKVKRIQHYVLKSNLSLYLLI